MCTNRPSPPPKDGVSRNIVSVAEAVLLRSLSLEAGRFSSLMGEFMVCNQAGEFLEKGREGPRPVKKMRGFDQFFVIFR